MSFNIFQFLDPNKALQSAYSERRSKNPSFSIRAWSKKLGMKSHNPLYEMLSSQRAIPRSLIPILIKDLDLNREQAQYFENLIELKRAKSHEQKNFYLENLRRLKPRSDIRLVEIENYLFFDDPLHGIIVELTCRKDFKYDLKWIQSNLPEKRVLSEIQAMIDRVIALGFVKEENDTLIRSQQHISNTVDVPHKATRNFHKKILAKAILAIDTQSVDEREYNTYFFNIKKQDLARAKKRLRDFNEEFLKEFEAKTGKADQTYALQIQLFNLKE